MNTTVRVRMADGSIVVSPKVLVDLPITLISFDSIETFYIIDLDERWDFILGMGWLECHNPMIDWRSKSMLPRTPPSAFVPSDLGVVSNEPSPNVQSSSQALPPCDTSDGSINLATVSTPHRLCAHFALAIFKELP
jgi:hypothetical protein